MVAGMTHTVQTLLDAYGCDRADLARIATDLAKSQGLGPVSIYTLYVWANRGLPAWARFAFAADIDRRKTERAA